MTTQHRQKTWNVERLSELASYQAKLWDQMAGTRRHKPEYYRVVSPVFVVQLCEHALTHEQAFYGEYSPAMNQGKEYIVRAEPWHQFTDL